MHEPMNQTASTTDVRTLAGQSLEFTRSGAANYIQFIQRALSGMPALASHELSSKALSHAEAHIERTFDLAQDMIDAKHPSDILKLQTAFVRAQTQAVTEQTHEITAAALKTIPVVAMFVPSILTEDE
jgi:hypothetical protein